MALSDLPRVKSLNASRMFVTVQFTNRRLSATIKMLLEPYLSSANLAIVLFRGTHSATVLWQRYIRLASKRGQKT